MAEAKIVKFKHKAEVTLTGNPHLLVRFKETIPVMSREYQPKRYCWRVDSDKLESVRELFRDEGVDWMDVLG